LVAATFIISYRYIAPPAKDAARPAPKPRPITIQLPFEWGVRLIMGLLATIGILSLLAFQQYLEGLKNLSMFNLGVVVMLFGLIAHIYRHIMQQVK
jgi:hypothetical protein